MDENLNEAMRVKPLVGLLEALQGDPRFNQLSEVLNANFGLFTNDGQLVYLSRPAKLIFGIPRDFPTPNYNLCKDDNFFDTEYSALIKSALSGEVVFLPRVEYKFTHLSIAGKKVSPPIVLRIRLMPIQDAGRSSLVLAIYERVTENMASQPILLMQRSESASMLARGIAHEFNNVFASIKGVASIIELDLSPEDHRFPYLRKLGELVERGVKLISELVSYVRLTEPHFESVNLKDYTEHFLGLAKLMVPRSVELITDVSGQGYLRADTHRLDQALFNLVHNAIEAVQDTQTKQVRIRIEVSPRLEEWERELFEGGEKAPEVVRITIEDSGPGIPDEVYPRIFDPYFSTKEPKRNTGLGLNVSEVIIHEHEGLLVGSQRSELGGARFSVYLPIKPEQ